MPVQGFLCLTWKGKLITDPVLDINGQVDVDATFEYIYELEKMFEDKDYACTTRP